MGPPLDLENITARNGMELHHLVSPDRWCVTYNDLLNFRCLVQKYVAEGRVVPTELDRFIPTDNVIGPCIHTINAQFIQHITDNAGKMSWAMMLHPDGLECDLFVTHC